MERLTERIDNVPDEESDVWVKNHNYVSAAEKLAEYEDSDEQGRLVKLPFMVGDRVYQINENFIEPCTVEVIFLANYTDKDGNYCNMAEIHYDRDDCPYVSTEIYFTDIGKTVFLTKSEAEAKLRLRGNNE